jgi:hypothetical protein
MSIRYESIVPWGRSYDEYVHMFALQPSDLKKRILGCGDGPADFNRVVHGQGGVCISIDPVFAFSSRQIQQRIDDTFQQVMAQTRQNLEKFCWTHIPSVEALGEIRMAAMQRFLEDFEKGKREGRYVSGALPALPFVERSFDVALSSHFLFLYSAHLSLDFHIAAIHEMLRVAGEARIFPVLDLNARTSPHLHPVMAHLNDHGYDVTPQQVEYEFQKGGHTQLVVRRFA